MSTITANDTSPLLGVLLCCGNVGTTTTFVNPQSNSSRGYGPAVRCARKEMPIRMNAADHITKNIDRYPPGVYNMLVYHNRYCEY